MNYQEATLLLEKYPYFAFAALMALPQAPDEKRKDELRRIIAVNIGDPIDLAEILGLNSTSLVDFYPDMLPPQLSTFDTIDTFLSTFGNTAPPKPHSPESPAATAAASTAPQRQTTPANPVDSNILNDIAPNSHDANPADILNALEALPPIEHNPAQQLLPSDATADAIDSFLKNVPPPQPRRPKQTAEQHIEEKPALTESFAQILIKNRNYDKALQIIQELNLNNPEKSIYFADQIRFLKKLIINQRGNSY